MRQESVTRFTRRAPWCGAAGLTVSAVLAGLATTACSGGGDARKVRQGPLPSEDRVVRVSGGAVQIGFAIGVIRETKNLDAFVISKFPVTRGEYLACVAAGGCTAAAEPQCKEMMGASPIEKATIPNTELADDVPAVCVGRDNADRYCGWLGGHLPALEEWMLAARGSGIERYAWGATVPTCEQHPFGLSRKQEQQLIMPGAFPPSVRQSCVEGADAPFATGRHPTGGSPLGLQDVLLTRGELLRASASAVFTACMPAAGGTGEGQGACVVHGMLPGAIDSVRRLARTSDTAAAGSPSAGGSPVPYSFRCAWGEGEFL